MTKPCLDRPLVVEGKYDKNTLSQLVSGVIVTTGGFSVFNRGQLVDYLKKLAEPKGLLILTDSDAGGAQIRRFLTQAVGKEKLIHLYIPQVEGKEKRKHKKSAQGWLGVEGTDKAVLLKLLLPFTAEAPPAPRLVLTKADLFALGLSGGENAAEKREMLSKAFGLPAGLTPNAWLEAVCTLVSPAQWEAHINNENNCLH